MCFWEELEMGEYVFVNGLIDNEMKEWKEKRKPKTPCLFLFFLENKHGDFQNFNFVSIFSIFDSDHDSHWSFRTNKITKSSWWWKW